MTNKDEKLRECPFCGCRPVQSEKTKLVSCGGCTSWMTKDRWNRRTPSPPPAQECAWAKLVIAAKKAVDIFNWQEKSEGISMRVRQARADLIAALNAEPVRVEGGQSRSVQRRIAAQNGEPAPTFESPPHPLKTTSALEAVMRLETWLYWKRIELAESTLPEEIMESEIEFAADIRTIIEAAVCDRRCEDEELLEEFESILTRHLVPAPSGDGVDREGLEKLAHKTAWECGLCTTRKDAPPEMHGTVCRSILSALQKAVGQQGKCGP